MNGVNTNSDFNLEHHRRVAERVAPGRATAKEVEASQQALLNEVVRTACSPASSGALIPTTGINDLVMALAKAPELFDVHIEAGCARMPAGLVGTYGECLVIGSISGDAKSVEDWLWKLRVVRGNGLAVDARTDHDLADKKSIWLAKMGGTIDGALIGIRIENETVLLVGGDYRPLANFPHRAAHM